MGGKPEARGSTLDIDSCGDVLRSLSICPKWDESHVESKCFHHLHSDHFRPPAQGQRGATFFLKLHRRCTRERIDLEVYCTFLNKVSRLHGEKKNLKRLSLSQVSPPSNNTDVRCTPSFTQPTHLTLVIVATPLGSHLTRITRTLLPLPSS
jgi:hypothetical protein